MTAQTIDTNIPRAPMDDKPGLPQQHDKQTMLKDIEALAKCIIGREMQTGDAEYEYELNSLETKYGIKKKALVRTLNRFLPEPAPEEEAAPEAPKPEYTEEEQKAAKELSRQPNIFKSHRQDLKFLGYCGRNSLCDTALTAAVARLLPKSSAYIAYGLSASGKSELFDQEEKLLPPEDVISYTSLSQNALNYAGVLKHKILKLGELPPKRPNEPEDNLQWSYLRQLLSGNKLEHGSVEDKPSSKGKHLVKHITEGPVVVLATTTRSPQDFIDEVVNRANWLPSDEREETTKDVLNEQSSRDEHPETYTAQREKIITRKWQCFHANLKSMPVIIPFAKYITPSPKHVTARRLYPLISNHVKASALAHQYIRKRRPIRADDILSSCQNLPNNNDTQDSSLAGDNSQPVNFAPQDGAAPNNSTEYLIADVSDYDYVYEQITTNAPRVLELVAPAALKRFQDKDVKTKLANKKLTIGDFILLLQESEATIRRDIRQYENAGLLVRCDEKRGKAILYELGTADPETLEGMSLGIITPAELKTKIENDPTYDESLAGNLDKLTDELFSLPSSNDRQRRDDRQNEREDSNLSICHSLSNDNDRIETKLGLDSEQGINFSPKEEKQVFNYIKSETLERYYPEPLSEAYTRMVTTWVKERDESEQTVIFEELDQWATNHDDTDWSWRIVGQIRAAMSDMSEPAATVFDGKAVKRI